MTMHKLETDGMSLDDEVAVKFKKKTLMENQFKIKAKLVKTMVQSSHNLR